MALILPRAPVDKLTRHGVKVALADNADISEQVDASVDVLTDYLSKGYYLYGESLKTMVLGFVADNLEFRCQYWVWGKCRCSYKRFVRPPACPDATHPECHFDKERQDSVK